MLSKKWLWSGVYYVSPGIPDEKGSLHNGKLELLDPREGSNLIRQGFYADADLGIEGDPEKFIKRMKGKSGKR